MNKAELIDVITAKTGESKAHTGEVVEAIMAAIKQAVAKDDTVQLVGFGSFRSGNRAARTGRNPQTGEAIEVAAAKTVKFTAGQAFKDAVNSAKKK